MLDEKLKAQHDIIKNRMDIITVIGQFLHLKEKSEAKGKYVCKCPFHNENTASFLIDRVKGVYYCFGCGAGGDTIKFIQDHLRLDYINTMKWLANFYNLPIDDSRPQTTFTDHKFINREELETQTPPSVFVPKKIFNQSLNHYNENNFVKFLHTLFEPCIVNMLIHQYYIGTSKYYFGGAVFWQVDETGNIRYGKVMGYNPLTGKRIKKVYKEKQYNQIMSVNGAILRKHEKDKTPPPDWVTKYDNQSPKPQVLFGLHLLNEDSEKPIAIVESEKTAIVASVFLPSFTWMATGAKGITKYNDKGELNTIPESVKNKFIPLSGRKVLLVPDLGAIEDWQYLASEISDLAEISVADIISTLAKDNNLPDKSDLCDYLTSDAARTELIQEYKNAILERNPETDGDHCEIWLEFSDRGLRRTDKLKAYKEMIAAGIFEMVDDEVIHPYYYSSEFKPPHTNLLRIS